MNELTLNQFLELNKNLIVDKNGNTNKKCPLCGNTVIVEKNGTGRTIKCKSTNCFFETLRGI